MLRLDPLRGNSSHRAISHGKENALPKRDEWRRQTKAVAKYLMSDVATEWATFRLSAGCYGNGGPLMLSQTEQRSGPDSPRGSQCHPSFKTISICTLSSIFSPHRRTSMFDERNAGLCFSRIDRQDEHLTSWHVEFFLVFAWLWKCHQRAKKRYKELHKALVMHGYSSHTQTTSSKIKSKFQISFTFFFFSERLGSCSWWTKYIFSTFLIYCEPTRPTHPTTLGHEIVNNVENARVRNVLRFLNWLLKSSIWCFCSFFCTHRACLHLCLFLFLSWWSTWVGISSYL